jgi:hypothetical protein
MRCCSRYSAWSKSHSLRWVGLRAKAFCVPEGDSSDLVIMALYQDVLDDIPAVQLNSDLSKKFRNGLNFDYFNEDIFEDTLLIISDEKLLGIGKVIEGKIKPVRVFNL